MRREEDRAAEQFVVGLFRRPRLTVFGASLAADPERRPGECADEAVARAVQEHRRGEGRLDLGPHRPPRDGGDPGGAVVVGGRDDPDVGVEVQVHVRFGAHEVEHDLVPVDRVALRVPVLVLEEELTHDPGLAGEPMGSVRGRPDHPHPDLARGVPTEDGAVGDEGDAGAEACGGDRGAHAGETASDDHDVVVLFTGLHGGDGITHWRFLPTVWQSVPGKCYRQRTLDNEV